jgi:peptidoglycan/xylan/chitin deacetylase (PgdA/CDA1 family)
VVILKFVIKYLLGLGIVAFCNAEWHKVTGRKLILNLHRVQDEDKSTWTPIPTRVFVEALDFIEKHFEITHLNDETKYKKPSVTLSFDDGFHDFYQSVLPIISERNLSVNHNIIPRSIETGFPPLNVTIQDFAGRIEEKSLRSIDWGFKIPENASARDYISEWSQKVKKKSFEEQIQIEELLIPQLIQVEKFRPTRMMSIRELRDALPLIHIGNHSFSHAYMSTETLDFFIQDFTKSQKWFEDSLEIRPDTYAFPNGAASQAAVDYLLSLKIKNVLLVGNRSTASNFSVKQRVNFSPQNLLEAKFDLNRPLWGIVS